jgi:cytoskeletal protein CcmA (bactofilin family)
MARTPFGSKGSDSETSTFTPPAASKPSSAPGGLTAFIDQGSEFEGKLSFKDTVRIDGRFRGEISSENTLIVGESGEIDASIKSKTVAISGSVIGDVTAQAKVVVHKTGRIEGNIEAQVLVVEEGAQIDGHVRMGKGPGNQGGDKNSGSASGNDSNGNNSNGNGSNKS